MLLEKARQDEEERQNRHNQKLKELQKHLSDVQDDGRYGNGKIPLFDSHRATASSKFHCMENFHFKRESLLFCIGHVVMCQCFNSV